MLILSHQIQRGPSSFSACIFHKFISVYVIAATVWAILSGVFFAVLTIMLFTISRKRIFSNQLYISSRKFEALALIVPICGVLTLNQLTIIMLLGDSITTGGITGVLGLQWYWVFDVSDQVLQSFMSFGNLITICTNVAIIFPVATPFLMSLSAVDVIHAVAFITSATKLDAIPARIVNVKMCSEVYGNVRGQCSELCGALHGFMPLHISLV